MTRNIRAIGQAATSIVAICRKCGKKLGGGFSDGGKQPLGKVLRRELEHRSPRQARVRLVETRCLKLCPKGAVAVLDSRDPRHILVIAARTPVAEVAARLGLYG